MKDETLVTETNFTMETLPYVDNDAYRSIPYESSRGKVNKMSDSPPANGPTSYLRIRNAMNLQSPVRNNIALIQPAWCSLHFVEGGRSTLNVDDGVVVKMSHSEVPTAIPLLWRRHHHLSIPLLLLSFRGGVYRTKHTSSSGRDTCGCKGINSG